MDTRKINIGVLLGADSFSGGGFQYEFSMLDILNKLNDDRFKFTFFTLNPSSFKEYKNRNINVNLINESFFQRIIRTLLRSYSGFTILSRFGINISYYEKKLKELKLDLIYFLSPSTFALDLVYLPFISTVWDLCYLDFNEFPEVRDKRTFEFREYLYSNTLRKSIAVIADSEYGKSNLIRRFNLDENRIHSIKFQPGLRNSSNEIVDIKSYYNIKNDYVFYPAQLWAHKNHTYILDAISNLKIENNISIDLVLTGSDKGNFVYLKKYAQNLGLENNLHYLGFVPEHHIEFLYRQSLSLVMPTYFGPTNIPPLEAFLYDTAVCYSKLPGLEDQVKGAAFLMDLGNPKSLSNSLLKIINKDPIVEVYKLRGKEILNSYNETDISKTFVSIFESFYNIRTKWT